MTTFDEVYTSFLYKVRDREIPQLDIEVLEDKLTEIVRNTMGRLAQECNSLYSKLNVNYDDKTFGVELDDYERELSSVHVLEYLSGFILDTDKLKQIMTDKALKSFHKQTSLAY